MKISAVPAAAALLLLLSLVPAEWNGLSSRMKAVKTMDFNDFIKLAAGDGFTIAVEGSPKKSFFTGRTYVHYETVVFSGTDDIRSRHRILYHTDEDFTLIHGDSRTTVRYSQVRTCLAPSYEKKYGRNDLKAPGNEVEKRLASLLSEDGVDRIELVEYGLERGRTYHARVKTESYHLPPLERGGRPQRRENSVLVISDRPFPNDVEMTPLYRGWSY